MIPIRRVLLLFYIILGSATLSHLSAQNGKFDGRITVKTFDCVANTVILQIQIRASSLDNNFMLGDANYRFSYNPSQINKPVLYSQDNFSNQLPASDNNYNAQSLEGSVEGTLKGILSVNCFYNGANNNAKKVDTAWVDVCCVKFNVVNAAKCFSIKWNDSVTFPASGMSEVAIESLSPFNFKTSTVKSNNYFENIDGCFPTACDNKAPIVTRKPIEVAEDSVVTTCMRIRDFNLSDTFSVAMCQNPANGIAFASVNNTNREVCLEYTPNPNFTGVDTVCVLVCDNGSPKLCDTVRLPITVQPRPDAPSVFVSPVNIQSGIQFVMRFTIIDSDVNDSFTATVCGTGKGTAQASVTGSKLFINYQSPDQYSGPDSVCVTVCDSYNLCQTVTVPINVLPCKDTLAPKITCPSNIEVTLGGSIVSDADNFILSSAISDNCQGVNLTFKKPTATDDCGVKSITQVSGSTSGSAFAVGNNVVTFEAADFSDKKTTCQFTITVQPISLLSVHSGSYCMDEVLNVAATSYPNTTYQWTGPQFSINSKILAFKLVNEAQKGQYTISATLSPTCSVKDTFNVGLKTAPTLIDDSYIIPINSELKDTVTRNDNLALNAPFVARVKNNLTSGSLTMNANGSFSYKPLTGFVGVEGFTYEVCYTNCPNACQTATVSIKVANEKRVDNRATNIITPNGDGVNEALIIEGFDPNAADNQSEITIFSQWGEKVYWAAPYNNNWEGTFHSQPLPVGTYYFIFKKDPDATPITSFVTIVR